MLRGRGEMTFRSAIFDSASGFRLDAFGKYALAFSSLRFSNGSTAMLFSDQPALASRPLGGVDEVNSRDTRWKRVKELITIARVATTKVKYQQGLGRRAG